MVDDERQHERHHKSRARIFFTFILFLGSAVLGSVFRPGGGGSVSHSSTPACINVSVCAAMLVRARVSGLALICAYVHTRARAHARAHTHTRVSMYASMCVWVWVCARAHVCVRVCVWVCVRARVYVRVCVRAHGCRMEGQPRRRALNYLQGL